MGISEIVDVQITRATVTVSRAGFGTLMVLSTEPAFDEGERFQYYASLAAVDADTDIPTDGDLYAALTEIFSQSPRLSRVCVGFRDTDPVETVAEALTAAVEAGADFYGVTTTSRVLADQESLASWCETAEKLGAVASAEDVDKAVDESGILFTLEDEGYDRTFGFYHSDAAESFPEMCLLARQFSLDPGSSTYANKTLTGISADTLTDTEKSAIEGKNGNCYIEIAGVSLTRYGTVGSGEYIDVIVGLDWLKARMAERIFGMIASEEKVPYTDAGVASIAAHVKAQLLQGITKGILAADPEPEVYTVAVADVDSADKAARLYPDVTWSAVLAGAIHKVEVSGRVSV